MIRAMLVDDEEPARDRLRAMLADYDDVHIVGEAEDGEQAIRGIAESRPDLVFLDIEMPGLTGMQVVASLEPPRPSVIFCTAFDQYAIDAFEHHAVDYLLKPLNRARLTRALDRVRGAMDERGRLGREMADAERAQARLLPQTLPALGTLDYGGICHSARGVGGDYYDFLALDGGRLGIALGDVSGKGLFAGILAASLQARVQSLAPLCGGDLESMIGELNRVMYASTHDNRYATLFYGLYDDATRELSYVNAGHNPPLLLRPGDDSHADSRDARRTVVLETGGTAVGLLRDARYEKRSLQLRPGDVLLVFSDGLTETVDETGEAFGESRLQELAGRLGALPAASIRDRIFEEVERYRGGAPAADDLTLITAKVV